MRSTSRGSRLVSSAARSPGRSSTGPEVWRRFTPSSRAMMCASVVLPRPGGPNSSTWSSASPRLRAAWMKISSCPRTFSWPTYSASVPGRNERSNCSSCGEAGRWEISRSVSTATGRFCPKWGQTLFLANEKNRVCPHLFVPERGGELAQLGALDLGRVGAGRDREFDERVHAHRELVLRHARRAVREDAGLVERGAGLQDHERERPGAARGVDADHLGGFDLRMLEQPVLDLARADEEAREPHRIAEAREEDEAAIGHRVAEVAAPEPAVIGRRLARRILVAEVADHAARHLEDQLAGHSVQEALAAFGIARLHPALGRDEAPAGETALLERRRLALPREQRMQLARAVEPDDGQPARLRTRRKVGKRGIEG